MPTNEQYSTSEGLEVPATMLVQKPKRVQLDVMRSWFFSQFEDPAEETSYDSSEGGYQYIWGGPFDAQDEIFKEFSGLVPDEVIQELATKLEAEHLEWAPKFGSKYHNADDLDDYSDTEEWDTIPFHTALSDIGRLAEVSVDQEVSQPYFRLLYAGVIAAMESYLADAFIRTVLSNKLTRRFVEETQRFNKGSIGLKDIFKEIEQMDMRVQRYLRDFLWHRLDIVQQMYQKVLGIELDDHITILKDAVQKRHDIVHRNGETRDGKVIEVSKDDLTSLIVSVNKLFDHIDAQTWSIDLKMQVSDDPAQPPEGDGKGKPPQ